MKRFFMVAPHANVTGSLGEGLDGWVMFGTPFQERL